MAKVAFQFKGSEIFIQCLKEEKMKDICKRCATKIDININSLLFIYNGNKINFELTFKQQTNSIDNNRNQMNILVYQIDNDKLKCKKCGEIIHLDIIDNIIKNINEQKDTLFEMKNQIDNIINLNNINEIKRKIKIVKIIIDNIINENKNSLNNIQNSLKNSYHSKINNNGFNFELTFKYQLDSNEENVLKNFVIKSVELYSLMGTLPNIFRIIACNGRKEIGRQLLEVEINLQFIVFLIKVCLVISDIIKLQWIIFLKCFKNKILMFY